MDYTYGISVNSGTRPRLSSSQLPTISGAALDFTGQNFSAAGAQPGHQHLDWGTFEKLCVLSLFLVEASYTVRLTTGSIHGRKITHTRTIV